MVRLLIERLETNFPEAARDMRKRVEDAIDEEFGESPKPFPIQSFSEPSGERFSITISAPGAKITEELSEESLSDLDSLWVEFTQTVSARIVDVLRRQTPGIADKQPD